MPNFTPLNLETRVGVSTTEAAHHLNRSAQTLRTWSCTQAGPLQPIRVGRRLVWPVADIKRLLGVQ